MLVGIASDHGGWALKSELETALRAVGYEIRDYGAFALDPQDDYPDYVIPLAMAVANGVVQRGIALCGSGVGACIAANKAPGVRAALINDVFSARQGVEDDAMNVICMGGKVIGSVNHPFNTADFSSFLLQAQARFQEAQAVFEDVLELSPSSGRA